MREPLSHTERWAYRHLYRESIFGFCSKLHPFLGRRGFRFVAGTVARFYAETQPAVVAAVLKNLRLLAPGAGKQDAKAVFSSYARTIADYTALGAMPPEHAKGWCGAFTDHDIVEAAAARGGAVLATGHYSFFEFGAVAMALQGFRIAVATMAEPTPGLTEWRARWRAKWGIETVEVGTDPFASMSLHKALSDGKLVAVLADRPMGDHGVPVEVAGGAVDFSIAPCVLARIAKVPVIPVAISQAGGGKYDFAALEPIEVARVSHSERDLEIRNATAAVGKSLCEKFARDPRQWFQFAPL